MLGNTMLKKRLRVFTNIASENEDQTEEGYRINKNFEGSKEKCMFPKSDFDSFLRCSVSNTLLELIQTTQQTLNHISLTNEKDHIKNYREEFESESNSIIISFPFKISEENIYSVLIYYGELESLSISSEENSGFLVNAKFYDLRSSKRAFYEISFNFEKLLNIFEREKFTITFGNNKQEIFEKFYLTLNIFDNIEDFMKIIQFIEIYSKIHRLYSYEDQTPQKKIIIKFFNSKERCIINFMLSRITTTLTNKKFYLSPEKFKNLKIILEKNTKIQDDLNFEIVPAYDFSVSSNKQKKAEDEDFEFSESLLNTSQNFKSVSTNLSNLSSVSPFEFKTIKNTPKTSLNFNKENILKNSNHKQNAKLYGNYKIIYDKNYSGIKKRNTPDDERKKYVVNINDIIIDKDMRTTLMIKNIPSHITQVDLLDKINKNYSSAYNFFYLPIDFNKKINAGYAFINFKTSKSIINFFLEFDNKPWDFVNNQNKICYLSYARIQGFRSICEHFQKSNIMKQVDEKVKPIIL